jgi:hypothetical protein
MVSVNILIKKHLEEYIIGKFGDFKNAPVVFPDSLDIYHLLYDLLCKRPSNAPCTVGTLRIAIAQSPGRKRPGILQLFIRTRATHAGRPD